MPILRTRTQVLERASDGSQVTLSVLPGGLRVVTESVPSARSASVGVWVGVGSIDERATQAGASHFLEHLLFKGTRTRTGREISAAIDAVGGDLNAFTAHEYTCFYAHVLATQAQLAVDLVCDVVLDAVMTADDVDIERSVILEEISMRDDDPEDTLADVFAAALFAGHPLADPVIGSVETITQLSRAQIAGYYRRRYQPEKMVVSVAGGIDHGDVLRWVRTAFAGRLSGSADPVVPRAGSGRIRPLESMAVLDRDIEQAHLSLGVPGVDRHDEQRSALAVLSGALGGGMSSRLFRSVREEHGLAYSCYAATAHYADTGSFSVYAGCQPENLGRVADLILAEFTDVATHGLEPAELARVKGQLSGGFLLGLEDTESRMSRIGKNILVRRSFRTVDEELAAIDAVTAGQVADMAGRLLSRPLTGAVVGPYRCVDDLPGELRDLVPAGAAGRRAAAGAGLTDPTRVVGADRRNERRNRGD